MIKGFTLIETLIALLVIAIGVGGLFALVNQTVSFTANAAAQLTATSLAQEGIEIARNIRDSNFLKIHNGIAVQWDDGLTGCSSSTAGCEADYATGALEAQDRFLNLANGFYSYAAGVQTQFKRKIFVDSNGTDVKNIRIQITWQERGKTHSITAATVLYNWLTPAP